MALEIERKFLVRGDGWPRAGGIRFVQGYLASGPEGVVRVRIAGPEAFLTIKSGGTGLVRQEFEYPIPLADAEALLPLCGGRVVEKVRCRQEFSGHVWEVDRFLGANEGLVLAEVELEEAGIDPPRPAWVGAEVTGDIRYYSSRLAEKPFTAW